jgi:hypothetical protein
MEHLHLFDIELENYDTTSAVLSDGFFFVFEQMRKWLVCFQKSVALVLSKLLLSSSHSYPDTKMAIAQYNHDHQSQNRQVCSEDGSHTPYKALR